jgi:hypothetical protein
VFADEFSSFGGYDLKEGVVAGKFYPAITLIEVVGDPIELGFDLQVLRSRKANLFDVVRVVLSFLLAVYSFYVMVPNGLEEVVLRFILT